MQERLQKIIARAGIASRRHAEQLILSGQVCVNGKTVRELGSKADTSADQIEVSGKKITTRAPSLSGHNSSSTLMSNHTGVTATTVSSRPAPTPGFTPSAKFATPACRTPTA